MRALDRLRRFARPRRRQPPSAPAPADLVKLLSTARVGAAYLSPRGRFLETNAALQELLGYAADELAQKDFDSVTHPDDLQPCRGQFERLRRGETRHFELDKRYVRKDGRTIWAHVVVMEDPCGGEGRWFGLAMDVTERKTSEEALRVKEEQYRLLYRRTPAMLQSIDRQGRLVSVSDRWLDTFGYAREEVLGRPLTAFFTEASKRYAEEIVLPAFFVCGYCSDVPYTMVRKDGGLVEVLLSASCERDEKGAFLRSLGVLVDVTERRRAERELESLRADLERRVAERTAELELRGSLLAAMHETSIDGILATDQRRRILSYNHRLLELWNAPEELARSGDAEATMRHALPLVTDPKAFLRGVLRLDRDPWQRSLDEIALKDGRTLERWSGPILGADGEPIGRMWYYHDITARKARERQLRERRAELERSNADLETYAYASSHDLAAPVRKISAYADLLGRSAGEKLTEKERSMLGAINRAAHRMAALIDDVLTLNRVGRERPPLLMVDLGEVLEHALSDLELVIAEARADVQVEALPRVLGQAGLLQRLFQNLLSNAVKFRRPGQAPRVRVYARPAGAGWTEVCVEDDGIGFEDRFAEKIFRPFLRLHPVGVYAGSGMGLAISRRIAQACGGTIKAAARPGEGARFTVLLRAA